MSETSFHIAYRPTSLGEVHGNKPTVKVLENFFKKKSIPHAILLHGPTGCGKTTLAQIIAAELGCASKHILQIDSGQFRGIDTIRDLRLKMQFTPIYAPVHVFLLDEVHKLTNDAQNAFLVMLENVPKYVYFILCTTEPQKLIQALKGRCSQMPVDRLTDEEMTALLQKTCKQEGKKVTDSILALIVKEVNGHARNGMVLLEQVLSVPKEDRLAVAKRLFVTESEGIDLCRALIQRVGWAKIKTILAGMKNKEAESVRRIVVQYAASVLLGGEDDNAALVLEAFGSPFYDTGFPQLVMACYIVYKG